MCYHSFGNLKQICPDLIENCFQKKSLFEQAGVWQVPSEFQQAPACPV